MNYYLDKSDSHYKYLARKFRLFAIFIIIAITVLAVHLRNSATPDYECPEATVIVQQYETLWSIANELCTGDIGKAVDDLVDKYGTTIYAGQGINLPIDGDDK